MRSLAVYGLIGALFGIWIFVVLAAIAVPAYHEYLMLQGMYRDVTAFAPLADFLGGAMGWLIWPALALIVWAWFLVAGRLNPELARLPPGGNGYRWQAAASWVGGGLAFLAALVFMSRMVDPGLFDVGSTLNIAKLLVALLAAGLAWALVSPQAFARFGANIPAALHWPSVARTAALGVMFILLTGLILRTVNASFMVWFITVTEALDRSMEPSLFGWILMLIGLVIMSATAIALAFGLLPAFVPGAGDWRARLVATRPAMILAGVMLVLGAAAVPLLISIDYLGNRKLADVAELSGIRPQSFRIVKFCADSSCRTGKVGQADRPLSLGKPVSSVTAYSLFSGGGEAPLHPESVTALERFAAGKGRYSVQRKQALNGAADIYQALWQPQEMFRLIDRFTAQGLMKHGSLLHTQMQLAWLVRAAPITDETRAMLATLSDEQRYFIGTRAASRLAAAWARFGDMQRAEAFLVRARKEGPGKYDHIRLVPGLPINGTLSGQIVLAGANSDGLRVGLFRMTDDPTRKPSPAEVKMKTNTRGAPPAFKNSGITVVTNSVVLKADGRFEFRHLGEGDYYLAVQIPSDRLDGKSVLTGINVPDFIRINGATPRRDLGVIRLTAK